MISGKHSGNEDTLTKLDSLIPCLSGTSCRALP